MTLGVSPLHVDDGNDDSNLILQQIFIVIAFVCSPNVLFKWRPSAAAISKTERAVGVDKDLSDWNSFRTPIPIYQ